LLPDKKNRQPRLSEELAGLSGSAVQPWRTDAHHAVAASVHCSGKEVTFRAGAQKPFTIPTMGFRSLFSGSGDRKFCSNK
jgi:hypothetical protein